LLIDLHAHILPGIDDGAQTIEDSLAMAEVALEDGITMLVATPHVVRGIFDNRKEDILKDVETLNNRLKKDGIGLLVLPGAEYRLEPDLPKRLAAGELLTLNNTGKYLLVELPASMVPEYTEQILYEIQLQGVTPIVAHPERNLGLAQKPQLLQEWSKRGIRAQITSASITGWFGRSVKKRALHFLHTGAAQIIASDGHEARGRAPLMHAAFKEIENLWGIELARTLSIKNPDLIIKGQPLKQASPPMGEITWAQYFKIFRAAE
jgi:protein-tyrosine phosphatase